AARARASLRRHVLLLLSGDRLLRTLTRTCVGLGALATDGQATTVAQTLVAADLNLATDIGLHLAAEVTLDLPGGLDNVTEGGNLVIGQVVGAQVGRDGGLCEMMCGTGGTVYV